VTHRKLVLSVLIGLAVLLDFEYSEICVCILSQLLACSHNVFSDLEIRSRSSSGHGTVIVEAYSAFCEHGCEK